MPNFKLVSPYKPTGDQPNAIDKLTRGLNSKMRDQTLLGVTGSGKSVVYDTPILISRGSRPHLMRIGTLVHQVFSEQKDNICLTEDGTEYVDAKSIQGNIFRAYSFDPENHSPSWQPIKQYIRHKSPNQLYEVLTQCGRKVMVTGDHNFFVLRKGKLQLVATQEIQTTDFLPIPRSIPESEQPLHSIDLGEELSYKNLFVRIPNFSKVWIKNRASIEPILSYQKRYFIVKHQERVPINLFSQLCQAAPELLQGALVGTKDRRYEVPVRLPITSELLKLIGYYIAEGHAASGYFIISAGNVEIIQDLRSICEHFGLHVKQRKNRPYDFQVSSLLWKQLLEEWCGSVSQMKRLPYFWTQLSNQDLAFILKAYFSGDGGVEENGVYCTSASEQLTSDLSYALLRFGLVARVRQRQMRIPGSTQRKAYWTLSLTGQEQLKSFKQQIGFIPNYKNTKLDSILKKKENTNVDIIPIDGAWLRGVRQSLGLSQIHLATQVGCARSFISLVESNKRKTSRKLFEKLIQALVVSAKGKNDEVYKNVLAYTGLSQLFWTPVKRIGRTAGEEYVYDISVDRNETFLAGSGGLFVHNTFTMANVVAHMNRPTLVISHNKTLAAQLASEFREFFPHNAVHYFVSYYDYYQPEAYVPQSDTYIEKETQLNEEIDRLRHASTQALLSRRDVLIVASVSCIYGLGSPETYKSMAMTVKRGQPIQRTEFLFKLIGMQYHRNDTDFFRGTFRVRGDTVEVFPAFSEHNAYQFQFFGDEVEKITEIDSLTGDIIQTFESIDVYPATHYLPGERNFDQVVAEIERDMKLEVSALQKRNKLLEAQRLEQRTKFDLDMLRETGYVNGIENYSRYFDRRTQGEPPFTLLDYFPKDFLMFVDESHMTIPQIGGMYAGDRARKQTLVDYGFRLKAAMDNRPLNFKEFEQHVNQVVYVSATPAQFELQKSTQVVEQLIRPTGLLDPVIQLRPTKGQVYDVVKEIRIRIDKRQRVLVTTLTKRMSEELTEFLRDQGIKVQYLHSDVDTLERLEILRDLRLGNYDVLVGINLLREGLDLPEVSLVVILDADKEGFLRSETSLVQTIGRAARHIEGKVIMYADRVTKSMKFAISETERRRKQQEKHNQTHGITPQTILKKIREDRLSGMKVEEDQAKQLAAALPPSLETLPASELEHLIKDLEQHMDMAAQNLEFEKAAVLRDQIQELKQGVSRKRKSKSKKRGRT